MLRRRDRASGWWWFMVGFTMVVVVGGMLFWTGAKLEGVMLLLCIMHIDLRRG